jgi:hypothetical protein
MDIIKLEKEVVVSDPCYTIPTWCQAVISNVKPGMYHTTVRKHDAGDWGNRCAMVFAIHEDYVNFPNLLHGKWEKANYVIGVDSGQCGIFSKDSYRDDNHKFPYEPYDFGVDFPTNDNGGDLWYRHMVKHTLSEQQWGTYEKGIVSTSGFGDGSYQLFVVKKRNKIVAFAIDFGVEDGKFIDFDYRKTGVKETV